MNVLTRRSFVRALGAPTASLVTLAALPRLASASTPASRELSFDLLHTGERLKVEYFSSGAYVPDALAAVDHLLRDFRTEAVGRIDPGLLDVLHALAARTGSGRPFEIISGYRSPATNAMLHARSSGVATKSLHMSGKAIDIRLGDVALGALRAAALSLGAGGVGYYPKSNFVHVDTGRVRSW